MHLVSIKITLPLFGKIGHTFKVAFMVMVKDLLEFLRDGFVK